MRARAWRGRFVAGLAVAACAIVDCRADTPAFNSAICSGTNQAGSIPEASGLAASRRNPHVIWTHNDSGDSARLFAINPVGALHGTYTLTGASAVDWEDMAIATDPINGVDYLYVGDIGDNAASRSSITVYRVPEPDVDTNLFGVTGSLTGVERYTLTYPDGARDAETLMADPLSGDLYIISKREIPSKIYRAAYPQSTNTTIVLSMDGTLTFGWAVGGDIAPSGRGVLLKEYNAMHYYARAPAQTIAAALAAGPSPVPYALEPQGEAVAWQGREQGYYTLSEGLQQPIYYYASSDSDGDELLDTEEVVWSTEMNNVDTDADGQSDGDEVIAGTSPTNSASRFIFDSIEAGSNTLTLVWFAREGRAYDVRQQAGALTNDGWGSTAVSNVAVSSSQAFATNMPLSGTALFFRLVVRRLSGW